MGEINMDGWDTLLGHKFMRAKSLNKWKRKLQERVRNSGIDPHLKHENGKVNEENDTII